MVRSCYIEQGAQPGALYGWDSGGMAWGEGRKAQEGGDMHIIMADLHCLTAEMNTTL